MVCMTFSRNIARIFNLGLLGTAILVLTYCLGLIKNGSSISTNTTAPAQEELRPKLINWCEFENDTIIARNRSEAIDKLQSVTLLVIFNFPFPKIVGYLQRVYQPFFHRVIFCGAFAENSTFGTNLFPVNHVNELI